MKRTSATHALIVLLAVAVGLGAAQRPPGHGEPPERFVSYLEQRLPGWMDGYGVPGVAIALVEGGEVVWTGAYGYADVEQRRELSADALFRVESISKSVSAWGVMTLVERGILSLEDPANLRLVDELHAVNEILGPEVTVGRLLSNSAGLPLGPIGEEYAPGEEMPSLGEFLAREARLDSQPGTRFTYSNVGYAVLESLVEEVTGRDFAAYMRDEVLVPLDMHRSSFSWGDARDPTLATGYDLWGVPVLPYVYPVRASGGLLATVEDVARFVAASMTAPGAPTSPVLAVESVRQLHVPQVRITGLYGFVADAYGAGHFTEELRDGRLAVWHGGQGHGWMSHFHAVPEAGDGIVILTNSQRSWPLMAVVLDGWSRWSGAGPLGMSTITRATTALRCAVGLGALVSLWLVIRLVLGLRGGARRWEPLSRARLVPRLLQAALGAATLVALTWAAAQPYLFVSSIFPGLVNWAAASFAVLAVVMIASAAFPQERSFPQQPSMAADGGARDICPGRQYYA